MGKEFVTYLRMFFALVTDVQPVRLLKRPLLVRVNRDLTLLTLLVGGGGGVTSYTPNGGCHENKKSTGMISEEQIKPFIAPSQFTYTCPMLAQLLPLIHFLLHLGHLYSPKHLFLPW